MAKKLSNSLSIATDFENNISCAPWDIAQNTNKGIKSIRANNLGFYAFIMMGLEEQELINLIILYKSQSLSFKYFKCRAINDPGKNTFLVIPVKRYSFFHMYEKNESSQLSENLKFDTKSSEWLNKIKPLLLNKVLDKELILNIERQLRAYLGNPEAGYAVYPKRTRDENGGAKFQPVLALNNIPNIGENILVKVTRASICQTDRRALLGTKKTYFDKRLLSLGHEGGGYVIDPGIWADEISAGQKVVFLPHSTCGESQCLACQNYEQNLCANMKHLGFHIDGNLADVISVPMQCVWPLSEQFMDDAIPLIEPLACVMRAIFKFKAQFNAISDRCLSDKKTKTKSAIVIYGCGPIGSLAGLVIKRFWPNIKVVMLDHNVGRLDAISHLNSLDTVCHSDSYTHSHVLSFVAASTFDAYMKAINHTENNGSVIMFSGVNTDEFKRGDCQRKTLAKLFEDIHRSEKSYNLIRKDKSEIHLQGSSGYYFDDIAHSISELSRYPDHYMQVQNSFVDSLISNAIYFPQENKSVTVSNVVEKLLAPLGVDDPDYGEIVSKTLKTLIRLGEGERVVQLIHGQLGEKKDYEVKKALQSGFIARTKYAGDKQS